MSNIIYAGYGKENITPDFDVCLAGYGNDIIRPAMGVEQQIYVTCVAVRNEEKTFLIYTMDGLSAHESSPPSCVSGWQKPAATYPASRCSCPLPTATAAPEFTWALPALRSTGSCSSARR